MAFNKVLAAAWLAAGLAGCAQGRDPAGGHASGQEVPRAPVATLGPDDGLPFTTTPGKGEEQAPAANPGSLPPTGKAANAVDDPGTVQPAGR